MFRISGFPSFSKLKIFSSISARCSFASCIKEAIISLSSTIIVILSVPAFAGGASSLLFSFFFAGFFFEAPTSLLVLGDVLSTSFAARGFIFLKVSVSSSSMTEPIIFLIFFTRESFSFSQEALSRMSSNFSRSSIPPTRSPGS